MMGIDLADLDVIVIQAAWALLLLASPVLCWLIGRAVGVGGERALAVAAVSIAVAGLAVAARPDEPLHANNHAWREAREVLMPIGIRNHGLSPFIHGKAGIGLQWLVAAVERRLTGTANPFDISRVCGAAAAAAAAMLTLVLVESAWAGLAAGCVLALMPLARMLAVSGSALAIPAWILPWSLALLLAAGRSGSRWLLAAAGLATALGVMSHTAMLVWPAGLAVAWALMARREVMWSGTAAAALLLVAGAWAAQFVNCFDMLATRNQGEGLLQAAVRGYRVRNLFRDPSFTSPLLRPLVAIWVVAGLRGGHRRALGATLVPLMLIAVPLFAVTTCSSDAIRYQGALLPLVTSLGVAGLWRLPLARWIGGAGAAAARVAALAALAVLPVPSMQQPIDPAVTEHRLVEEAARQMAPNTAVIIPAGRYLNGRVLTDFPDFLLPPGSFVLMEGDPRIAAYDGPKLLYLGLGCISWAREEPDAPGGPQATSGMRPECRALRGNARPWLVRTLDAAEIPRGDNGEDWTFHALALGEPFGFFAPP